MNEIIEKVSVGIETVYSFEAYVEEDGRVRIEAWKDIKGYKGAYQVSSAGRIRSLNREVITESGQKRNYKGKIMKQRPDKDGYLMVTLSVNGRAKTFQSHRLVADAFIDNPENKAEVNHIDFNKQNNDISNLEWNTRQENTSHYADGSKSKKQALMNRVKEEPDAHYKDLVEEFGFSVTLTYKLRNKALAEIKTVN